METGFKRLSHFLSSGNLIAKEGSPLGSKGHLAWIGLTHQKPAASSHPLPAFRLKDGAVEMHQRQWESWLENGKPQTKLKKRRDTDLDKVHLKPNGALWSQLSLCTCFIPGWVSSYHEYSRCGGLLKWSWSIIAFCSIFPWHLTKAWCHISFFSGSLIRQSGLCTFIPLWIGNESLGFTVAMFLPLS